MHISEHDKLACVVRELKRRRRVYPNRLLTHRMTQAEAQWETAVMAAIVADYCERSKGEELPLDTPPAQILKFPKS